MIINVMMMMLFYRGDVVRGSALLLASVIGCSSIVSPMVRLTRCVLVLQYEASVRRTTLGM